MCTCLNYKQKHAKETSFSSMLVLIIAHKNVVLPHVDTACLSRACVHTSSINSNMPKRRPFLPCLCYSMPNIILPHVDTACLSRECVHTSSINSSMPKRPPFLPCLCYSMPNIIDSYPMLTLPFCLGHVFMPQVSTAACQRDDLFYHACVTPCPTSLIPTPC